MRVCILTTGQPSTNPRIVKEADALTEAGYEVHVICAHWASWADETDKKLLASREWSCVYVGGTPSRRPLQYFWTRGRHRLSLRALKVWSNNSVLRNRSLCRVQPELMRAAQDQPADLYIAHYPGALPAAVSAAETHAARVGFDAEDLYAGASRNGTYPSPVHEAIAHVEQHLLPQCNYVTAASSGIADAYAAKYDIRRPVPILNVFPLAERPGAFRPTEQDTPLALYWFSQTIGAQRGLEDVVQAMGLLSDCNIELHLRGNWQPGYRAKLFEFAASVGLRAEQIVAHDPVPPDTMIRHASQFDVGLAVEPGRDENNRITVSNKMFTYLLAGNAVVATSTPGQQSIMEQIEGSGFSYPPGDVSTLVAGLKTWYEDRATLHRARDTAWYWGTHKYNWDIEKHKFLQIVDTVLTERRTRC